MTFDLEVYRQQQCAVREIQEQDELKIMIIKRKEEELS